jgi:CHAT domain-containing protein
MWRLRRIGTYTLLALATLSLLLLSEIPGSFLSTTGWAAQPPAHPTEIKLPKSETAPSGILQQAQQLNTQGASQLNLGQPEAALATWEKAQKLYRQAGDTKGLIGSQINQAQALQTMGLYRRARTLLSDLQKQITQQSDPELKTLGLHSLGSILQATGYLNDSKQVLEQAFTLAQQSHLNTDTLLLTLGNTYRAQKVIPLALKTYDQVIDQTAEPLIRLEAQLNQLNILIDPTLDSNLQGSANPSSKRIPALITPIEQTLQTLSPSRRSIYAQINLAASLMKIKESTSEASPPLAPALQAMVESGSIAPILTRAIEQSRQIQDSRAESYALGQLGQLYEQASQWRDAESLTRKALLLAQTQNAPDITYRWQWQLGRVLKSKLDNPTDTSPTIGPTTGQTTGPITGQTTAQKANPRTKQNSAKQAKGVSKSIARSVDPARYKESIDAYRDAVTTLRQIRSDLVATEPELQFSFRESIEPIYRELVDLLVNAKAKAEDLKEARTTIEELQLAELENFFRSACLDVQKQQIDEIDPSAAVIYPILLGDRLEVIMSFGKDKLIHHTIPLPQAEVEETLDQWLQSLNPAYSSQEQLKLSQTVYDWLIRPASEQLKSRNIKTLVFVPDGLLRSLPMSALHDGNHYLIEDYRIAITPGFQLLAPRQLVQDQLRALTVGLTEARQGFAALPGVQQEIDQIRMKLNTKVILNEQFTKTNLREQLGSSNYPIVHLATHGQFSSDPEQTFLLTWDDTINVKDVQSILHARRLEQSKPIELLVLSACQTAAGDKQAALGLAGLAIQSGARSTLATLWSVNDRSTAQFMTALYRNLTASSSISRGESVRQAQLSLLQNPRYSHPFYWATFTLIGNWL